jgi:hypothetical protein
MLFAVRLEHGHFSSAMRLGAGTFCGKHCLVGTLLPLFRIR